MQRLLFREEHEHFRSAVRRFLDREVVPQQQSWLEQGTVDRSAWRKAGQAGLLCPWVEAKYQGADGDLVHSMIVIEELARIYETGFMMSLHSDICAPYIHRFGNEEQKQRWLPGCVNGEQVLAIAMTEAGAGSDLMAMTTRAVRSGDSYVIDGAKTFISNGQLCDLCIVAAKTEAASGSTQSGISLFVVESGTPGFVKGRKLSKIGMCSQDTSELWFDACRVNVANRLGEEGSGFSMLMELLQQERLVLAAAAQAMAEQILKDTLAYCKERRVFGASISKLQNTQFQLAECAAKVEVGRVYIDQLVVAHMSRQPLIKDCSIAKLWHTEMLGQVADACIQLFGGNGFMTDFPISRAFVDARVQRIYGGTSEVMKVIIARHLGL